MMYEKVRFDDNDENAFPEVYVSDKVGDFVCNANSGRCKQQETP